MSHMSNYANDRLAPYTFSALFEFILNNTNLALKYAPTTNTNIDSLVGEDPQTTTSLGPAKLAEHYFKLYANEKDPVWNVSRHLMMIGKIGKKLLIYCISLVDQNYNTK